MHITELLPRLDGVRKNVSGYTARCPAHDDQQNSLSVSEKDGRILLYCHTGCQFADILKALDLEPKDLFSNGNGSKPHKRPAVKSPKLKGELVRERVWDIVDSSDQVIARHHRKDYDTGKPKHEKEVWWERNGKKGLDGLKTEDLPLYGLKWLLDEPDDSERDIVICEGEPAADALHEAGYMALATVTGANGCPSEESLVPLLGPKGRIILWPDNDDPGRAHMSKVAAQLHEMGVTCYRLDWPEAPDKGDAADFVQAGGDVSSLLRNKTHICIYRSGHPLPVAKRDKNGTENGTFTMQSDPENLSPFEGLAKRVRDWVEDTSGWWETRELDTDLEITGCKHKENRKKILQRLREQGIIERHPRINKQFRYINTRTTRLDFRAATKTGVLPIKWPLGIEQYVNLFPGNLAVVAGSPNAGKTGLLLNFIHLNQDDHTIHYFCSEMGDVELRDRLDKFPSMSINDWHFEAIERASNFADVIRPDCVNVIDFLEMTTDLYMVNTYLTEIQHKLGSGIAVVAIQKKQGADFGRGQEFSLEKPKLYLSMDKGQMHIIKGKSWAQKNVDPNGLQISFKIVDGCQFQATNKWTARQ